MRWKHKRQFHVPETDLSVKFSTLDTRTAFFLFITLKYHVIIAETLSSMKVYITDLPPPSSAVIQPINRLFIFKITGSAALFCQNMNAINSYSVYSSPNIMLSLLYWFIYLCVLEKTAGILLCFQNYRAGAHTFYVLLTTYGYIVSWTSMWWLDSKDNINSMFLWCE
jgi:hypothetical protein